MSKVDEELRRAISRASAEFFEARDRLEELFPQLLGSRYDPVGLTEEFGATYTESLVSRDPVKFGLSETEAREAAFNVELRKRLAAFVTAQDRLDTLTLEDNMRRDVTHDGERVMAIDGELATLDIIRRTMSRNGEAPEPLVLTEGAGPEHGATRSRRRDRGRSR
ncbi:MULTISPECIES: hypothetical protein [Rhodomicrobium]|uniref:hypothetical protein n=1 Tax=Rhodomicrobium TaxID=1068 RepID=UPI0001C24D36|nr:MULTISPECIES: hypothetical protein [Rhodomicrobium]MBT3069262.1 hypothetical protein [Rhodomicrobium sp. Az07]